MLRWRGEQEPGHDGGLLCGRAGNSGQFHDGLRVVVIQEGDPEAGGAQCGEFQLPPELGQVVLLTAERPTQQPQRRDRFGFPGQAGSHPRDLSPVLRGVEDQIRDAHVLAPSRVRVVLGGRLVVVAAEVPQVAPDHVITLACDNRGRDHGRRVLYPGHAAHR